SFTLASDRRGHQIHALHRATRRKGSPGEPADGTLLRNAIRVDDYDDLRGLGLEIPSPGIQRIPLAYPGEISPLDQLGTKFARQNRCRIGAIVGDHDQTIVWPKLR